MFPDALIAARMAHACGGVFAITAILGSAGSAGATVWQLGEEPTYGQGLWGGDPGIDAGATLLAAGFDTVYASQGGAIVGTPSGFTMIFTASANVLAYMPSIGPDAALNSNVLNPISTSSGAFGGDVLGLELNVDFSDAGFLPAASGIRFGDLVLAGFSALPQLDGLTVRQFPGDMNTLLSGGTSIVSIADIGTPPSLVARPASSPKTISSPRVWRRGPAVGRSHECERGTHECVRHGYAAWPG